MAIQSMFTSNTLRKKDLRQTIHIFAWISTMTIGLFASHCPQYFQDYISLPLTVIMIVCIGIPHGSIDHLLYYEECRNSIKRMKMKQHLQGTILESRQVYHSQNLEKDASDNKIPSSVFLTTLKLEFLWRWLFYWNYLMIMSIWGISWYIFPQFAFCTFLIVSAYHFGESDLDYLNLPKPFDVLLYLSRGTFLIGEIASAQVNLTLPIIVTLAGNAPWTSVLRKYSSLVQTLCIAQHFFVLFILLIHKCFHSVSFFLNETNLEHQNKVQDSKESHAKVKDKENQREPQIAVDANHHRSSYPVWYLEKSSVFSILIELIKSMLFVWLFQILDPLTGFAVYFGLWHSLGSTLCEIGFLQNNLEFQGVHFSILELPEIKSKAKNSNLLHVIERIYSHISKTIHASTDKVMLNSSPISNSKNIPKNAEMNQRKNSIKRFQHKRITIYSGTHQDRPMNIQDRLSMNDNPQTESDPKIVSFHSLCRFISLSFLFTFIASTGMFVMYMLFSQEFESRYSRNGISALTEIWVVFIIFISVLTGPHIWLIYCLHQRQICLEENKQESVFADGMWRKLDPLLGTVVGDWVFQKLVGEDMKDFDDEHFLTFRNYSNLEWIEFFIHYL